MYIKSANKWWDGYAGEKEVLLDDLAPKHECLDYHIKIWADHYPFKAETKGGNMDIRPERIHITSQYTPEEIFKDPKTVQAIRRRFRVTHMSEPFKYKPKPEPKPEPKQEEENQIQS